MVIVGFYQLFVELCEARGVAPTSVAGAAGLDKSIVSYWKKHPNAKIKLETLKKIAAALNVPITSLMTQDATVDTSTDLAEYCTRYEVCLNVVCDDSGVPDHIKRVVQETRPDKQEVENALFVVAVKAAHSGDEDGFRSALSELSAKGRQEALKRIKEMAYVPDYQKEKAPPAAPQEAPEGE